MASLPVSERWVEGVAEQQEERGRGVGGEKRGEAVIRM